MPVQPRLSIEGLPELRRLLRTVGGRELPRQLGKVHRRIGEMVIAQLGGKSTGVGRGRGEAIRPSSAQREVLLRVGGSHRSRRREQWGASQIWPGGEPPFRPHLIAAAVQIQDRIEDEYMRGVDTVIQQARLA